MKAIVWDRAKARALYDQDLSITAIAKACGVRRSLVFATARDWPKRAIDAERHAKYFHPGGAPPKPPRAKRLKRGEKTLPPL